MKKETTQNNYIFYILFFCFNVFLTTLKIDDLSLRMATVNSDVSYVVYSELIKNPEKFESDVQVFYNNQIFFNIINHLSFVMESFFNVDTAIIFFLQLFFQIFLISFMIGIYLHKKTKSSVYPFLISLFFFIYTPYLWNLGWFGALDTMPYSMWQSIPFSVIGILLALEKKFIKQGFILVALSIFIHTMIGFYSVILFFIIEVLILKQLRLAKYFYLAGVFIFYYVIIINVFEQIFTRAEIPRDLLNLGFTNDHFTFFDPSQTSNIELTLRAWFFLLAFMLSAFLSTHMNKILLKFNSILLIFLALGIFGQKFLNWGFLASVSFIAPIRISVIALLLYIVITLIGAFNLFKKSYFGAFLLFTIPLPAVILIIGLLSYFKKRRTMYILNFLALMAVSPALFNLIAIHIQRFNLSAIDFRGTYGLMELFLPNFTFLGSTIWAAFNLNQNLFLILFAFLCIAFMLSFDFSLRIRNIGNHNRTSSTPTKFFEIDTIRVKHKSETYIKIFLFLFLFLAHNYGYRTHSVEYSYLITKDSAYNLYQAQQWAKMNSKENDSFLITFFPNAWTTTSERAKSFPGIKFNAYSSNYYPQAVDLINESIINHWTEYTQYDRAWFINNKNYFANSENLSDDEIVYFADRFGTDYLVERIENAKNRTLKKSFENSQYVIYDLNKIQD